MVRASIAAEKAGVPAVSIASTGFLGEARAIAKAAGLPDLPVAEYPGVILTDSKETLLKKVEELIVDRIVKGLATPVKAAPQGREPGPRDIVFKGTLDDVHRFFYRNLWTDGLPVIPPTISRVEQFLRFTDHNPEEVIGVLPPETRQATVWNVAVNGVMAGCRPEYMPILLAAVSAVADPVFRLEDAGSTPGWEPLIILNGPVIKELDFNYDAGVMRVGRQANTSIGRFLRLYMRNVAGLRIPPGQTDKATISYTFNVVLPENEDAVAEMGW
ncbi:MAG: UGSC family (seleno)protein, partial [Chloroflexota bacterium]